MLDDIKRLRDEGGEIFEQRWGGGQWMLNKVIR